MSIGAMEYTTSFLASFVRRYDKNGGVWLEAVAHGSLTAKTPYKIIINENGQVTAALADDTNHYYVGVPAQDYSTGDLALLQIGGICEDVITPSLSVAVGHALSVDGGTITDVGADFSGAPSEFAACRTESTTSTTQDLMLIPERITGTT